MKLSTMFTKAKAPLRLLSKNREVGSGEWGVGSGEWGVGSGEWGFCPKALHDGKTLSLRTTTPFPTPYSLLPTPHFNFSKFLPQFLLQTGGCKARSSDRSAP